jgi:hypothetical protein
MYVPRDVSIVLERYGGLSKSDGKLDEPGTVDIEVEEALGDRLIDNDSDEWNVT